MAIQSIGATTGASAQQLAPAAKSGSGSAGASQTSGGSTGSAAKTGGGGGGLGKSAASSTTIVSETSYKNADGWTTPIITYADGHTETKTTPPTQGTSAATRNGGGSNANAPARGGNNVNVVV